MTTATQKKNMVRVKCRYICQKRFFSVENIYSANPLGNEIEQHLYISSNKST